LTTTADFYSLPSAEYTVGASNEVLLAQSNRVRLRKIVEKLGEAWPKQLAGLLVQRSGADPAPLAFAVNVPISEAPKTASVGVLVSFLILAGVVIGVQQAGHLASWGMQFQNVQFLVAMTLLITLVAMNLFGVFEVNLGSSAMSAAGELAAKQGVTGAFFNGIL